jgi:hypothetical protein
MAQLKTGHSRGGKSFYMYHKGDKRSVMLKLPL